MLVQKSTVSGGSEKQSTWLRLSDTSIANGEEVVSSLLVPSSSTLSLEELSSEDDKEKSRSDEIDMSSINDSDNNFEMSLKKSTDDSSDDELLRLSFNKLLQRPAVPSRYSRSSNSYFNLLSLLLIV